jgi:hypothetical protein
LQEGSEKKSDDSSDADQDRDTTDYTIIRGADGVPYRVPMSMLMSLVGGFANDDSDGENSGRENVDTEEIEIEIED